ncbi:hypothetical protein FEE59_19335 [Herbaspirillum sp. RU 5E]|nr:hypothetical protein [Herbaspirillum sp. RU 5E]
MPVQGGLKHDESIMGFVLRMANANEVQGIHWLYQRLNRDKLNRFKFEDCSSISTIFGVPIGDIQRAMWRRRFIDGSAINILDTIKVTRSYLIRPLRPQICILCLTEIGYCRLAWDLQFVCVCPVHLCALIDQCPNCGRHIQWMRPLLHQCNCGLPWHKIQAGHRNLGSPEIQLAAIFQHKIRPNSIALNLSDSFDLALSNLSIDAVSKLVWIFGFKENANSHIGPGRSQKALRTEDALSCIERGYSRLRDFCSAATRGEVNPVLDSVHLSGIRGFVSEADSPPDSSFADWLSRELVRQSNGKYSATARTQRQLHLF